SEALPRARRIGANDIFDRPPAQVAPVDLLPSLHSGPQRHCPAHFFPKELLRNVGPPNTMNRTEFNDIVARRGSIASSTAEVHGRTEGGPRAQESGMGPYATADAAGPQVEDLRANKPIYAAAT
ncbi:hypothetical protein THAOC_14106, partial [Thalassiosira oceanica]